MSLDSLVKDEAKKSGISQKNAEKALKLLKSGKISMSDIAPQLKDMMLKNSVNDIADPKQRLHNKIKGLSRGRQSEFAKKADYDKKAEEIKKENAKTSKPSDVTDITVSVSKKNKRKRDMKKFHKLNEIYGKISEEEYISLQTLNKEEISEKDKKIIDEKIELYERQNKFTSNIILNDLDDLIIN